MPGRQNLPSGCYLSHPFLLFRQGWLAARLDEEARLVTAEDGSTITTLGTTNVFRGTGRADSLGRGNVIDVAMRRSVVNHRVAAC